MISDYSDKVSEAVSATDVRRAAMDLLARREHSYRELFDKLVRRFGSSLVEQELGRLKVESLQSDERFAEAYLHSRSQRLYGPLRIRMELRERGIADSVIASVIRESSIDWRANLEKLALERFGRKPAADFNERAKRMRFLQNRGFDAGEIRAVVSDSDSEF